MNKDVNTFLEQESIIVFLKWIICSVFVNPVIHVNHSAIYFERKRKNFNKISKLNT